MGGSRKGSRWSYSRITKPQKKTAGTKKVREGTKSTRSFCPFLSGKKEERVVVVDGRERTVGGFL